MPPPKIEPAIPADRTAHPTSEPAALTPDASALAGLLTHEDVDRARDRWQVARARTMSLRSNPLGRLRLLWLLIGPGILVFLA